MKKTFTIFFVVNTHTWRRSASTEGLAASGAAVACAAAIRGNVDTTLGCGVCGCGGVTVRNQKQSLRALDCD